MIDIWQGVVVGAGLTAIVALGLFSWAMRGVLRRLAQYETRETIDAKTVHQMERDVRLLAKIRELLAETDETS